MASASRNGRTEGVEFVHEDDGKITAVDLETDINPFLVVWRARDFDTDCSAVLEFEL